MASFIRSSESDRMVQELRLGSERSIGSSAHLMWEAYEVSDDGEMPSFDLYFPSLALRASFCATRLVFAAAASWLYSLVSVVEAMPVSITIVDVQLAGLPLIYVNQEFCRVTGYSKSEAQGKNCRFLQGPETQLASMCVIIDAIRRGEDCSVRLNNYKR